MQLRMLFMCVEKMVALYLNENALSKKQEMANKLSTLLLL